jgi:hypothetical protein
LDPRTRGVGQQTALWARAQSRPAPTKLLQISCFEFSLFNFLPFVSAFPNSSLAGVSFWPFTHPLPKILAGVAKKVWTARFFNHESAYAKGVTDYADITDRGRIG